VVERGPAGAREPIGEPTVPGVRSAALPGDRDIAAERRGLTGPPQEGRGAEREPARPPVAAPPAPTVAPGMVIAPEEEQPGTGGRDLGVGRVRLRKVVRSEGTNVPVGAQSETPPPPTSVPVGVQRETPPPAEPVRTGKDLEDTGQAGVIQPTGSTGTGTGAGTSGTGSSGLTGAEPEAERARERLDR
jgi:hypothetical protein